MEIAWESGKDDGGEQALGPCRNAATPASPVSDSGPVSGPATRVPLTVRQDGSTQPEDPLGGVEPVEGVAIRAWPAALPLFSVGNCLTFDKIEALHHVRDTTIAEDSYAGALPA